MQVCQWRIHQRRKKKYSNKETGKYDSKNNIITSKTMNLGCTDIGNKNYNFREKLTKYGPELAGIY